MKGLPRSLGRAASARAHVRKTTIPFKNLAVSVVGATGVGFGGAMLGDFPQGNILILGASAYVQVTNVDADATATFTGDYSVGTTVSADATLSGTDANIIPSTALAAATAGVSPLTRGISAAPGAPVDNTDGSLELNLNILIADASISGTADVTASGVVTIAYIVLGDD